MLFGRISPPSIAVERVDLPEVDPVIVQLVAQAAKLAALAQGCANSEDRQWGRNVCVCSCGEGKAGGESIAVVVIKIDC